MADTKQVISELKKIASELDRLAFRVELLQLELADEQSAELRKLNLYRAVKMLCFRSDPDGGYLLQSEIFGFIGAQLPRCPLLQDACERMGWRSGRPSNVFWRGFWPWLAAQEGVDRIVLSKNNIRFFGIKKAFWEEIPERVTDIALKVLRELDADS